MINVAYLRVYRPAETVRLPVTVGAGDVPRLGEAVLTTESQVADAWEVTWQGRAWRCPRTPRRRMLESLVAHHQTTERFGLAMIDRAIAEAARRELKRIRTGAPGPAPVMASAWHPPLRWFTMFTPEDLVEPMLLRTDLTEAVAQLFGLAENMREAGLPEMWIDEIDVLSEWLDTNAEEGMVELDYRQVGIHLDPVDRVLDETVQDMYEVVRSIAELDVELASMHYTTALSRWADAQAIAFSS